jgi:hypothetical protein
MALIEETDIQVIELPLFSSRPGLNWVPQPQTSAGWCWTNTDYRGIYPGENVEKENDFSTMMGKVPERSIVIERQGASGGAGRRNLWKNPGWRNVGGTLPHEKAAARQRCAFEGRECNSSR